MPSKPTVNDAPYLDGSSGKIFGDHTQKDAPPSSPGHQASINLPKNYDLFRSENRPDSWSQPASEERSNGQKVLFLFLGALAFAILASLVTNIVIGFSAGTTIFIVMLLVFIAIKK